MRLAHPLLRYTSHVAATSNNEDTQGKWRYTLHVAVTSNNEDTQGKWRYTLHVAVTSNNEETHKGRQIHFACSCNVKQRRDTQGKADTLCM